MLKTKLIKAGDWRTVESFWNASAKAFFREPAGARIRVRYGGWWSSWNRQTQVLDGVNYKVLSVGRGSLIYARMQVSVPQDTNVTYDVYGGGVAQGSPEIPF